jgi:biotin carboxyl carrier protein
MKQYRITVNGKSYDVTVEELGAARSAPVNSVAATPAVTPSPAPAVAPASTQTAAAAPANGGSIVTIKAPMPGTVIAFKVIVGQQVKRGDVLLLLEAMKMENEIVAPQDGTIAALRVPASAAVNTGDALVDLA